MSAPAEVTRSALSIHIDNLNEALRCPETRLETARQWGRQLAVPLLAGNRLQTLPSDPIFGRLYPIAL